MLLRSLDRWMGRLREGSGTHQKAVSSASCSSNVTFTPVQRAHPRPMHHLSWDLSSAGASHSLTHLCMGVNFTPVGLPHSLISVLCKDWNSPAPRHKQPHQSAMGVPNQQFMAKAGSLSLTSCWANSTAFNTVLQPGAGAGQMTHAMTDTKWTGPDPPLV